MSSWKKVVLGCLAGLIFGMTLGLTFNHVRYGGKREAASLIVPGRPKRADIKINLPEKVDEARKALAQVQSGFRICEAEQLEICALHTVLAVAHGTEGKIQLIHVDGNKKRVTTGYVVEYSSLNGKNFDFHVTSPEGYIVLALRRAVNLGNGEYTEEIYTPYSPELDEPAMRQRGRDYLESTVKESMQAANRKNLASKAFPDSALTDMFPADFLTTTALIENMGSDTTPNGIAEGINRVLTELGANQDATYSFSRSKKGALGLFQNMPATYAEIHRRNPEANLIPDFAEGMRDHKNAALASLLLMDENLLSLTSSARAELRKDPTEFQRFTSAAYNLGVKDAKKERWPSQTRTYVEKFFLVHVLLYPSKENS